MTSKKSTIIFQMDNKDTINNKNHTITNLQKNKYCPINAKKTSSFYSMYLFFSLIWGLSFYVNSFKIL